MLVQPCRDFTLPLYFATVRSGDLVGGRFRIESLAGSGGMGSVWRAHDQETGRRVALKLLHGRDPRDTARFVREAQLIAGLDHPGIVRYVADGQIGEGERFLVMEWLDGESLSERMERQPLSLAETLVVGRRTAEALGAMHGRGVVHRDLKPSNLFLEGKDAERVKLIDFGIARRSVGPDVTRTGVLLGTPGYIAPEQALGDRNVDARADVFALGCVLFKCLTGEGAFGGEDDLTVLLRIVKGTARRVREVVPRLPQEVDAFVAWMLARQPEERPRDASVVAAGLARLSSIYGAARPGDDPLDDFVTTRSRAVDLPEGPELGSTSPFPLTVPRAREPAISAAPDDDHEEVELITDASQGELAADVARALEEAERAAAAQIPSPPIVTARPPTPAPARVPGELLRRSGPNPAAPPIVTPQMPTPPPMVPPPAVAPMVSPQAASPVIAPPLVTVPQRVAVAQMPTPPPAANKPTPPSFAAVAPAEEAPDPRAVAALRNAEQYLKQNDFRNALLQTRRGIEAGARGELYGALRTRQAEAHRWRGELLEAERAAIEGMTVLAPGGELWWLAAREAVLAAGTRNDAARVASLAEDMMRLLPRQTPDAASVGTLACAAAYLLHTGQTEIYERFLGWIAPLLRTISPEPAAVAARLHQVRALVATHEGDLAGYLHASESAAERFAAASDLRNSLTQHVNAAFAKRMLGAFAHAEGDLRQAIANAERMGLNHVLLGARANLGVLLSKRGADAEARTTMLEVVKESIAEGDRRFEAAARTHLSSILLASGDLTGAVREARAAIEMTLPSAPQRAFALATLARAQLACERPLAALEAAEQAMDLLVALGGIEEGESLVRLVFAEAKKATGDEEGAVAAIAAARERLQARALLIKDAAFRQSFLREVPENARTLRLAREWLDESGAWPGG
jgi:serine/threonine protein kinase/tetratricopeptide (TPR) repeat protein